MNESIKVIVSKENQVTKNLHDTPPWIPNVSVNGLINIYIVLTICARCEFFIGEFICLFYRADNNDDAPILCSESLRGRLNKTTHN